MTRPEDLPFVHFPGSEDWTSAYEAGEALDARFPGQDAIELLMACEYNDYGPLKTGVTITGLLLSQQGYGDGDDWIWYVKLADDPTLWVAQGGCDYTGWDCQSSLAWTGVGGES